MAANAAAAPACEWTAEEDAFLLHLASEIGLRWTEIAHELNGRSYSAVRSRYHRLTAPAELKSAPDRTQTLTMPLRTTTLAPLTTQAKPPTPPLMQSLPSLWRAQTQRSQPSVIDLIDTSSDDERPLHEQRRNERRHDERRHDERPPEAGRDRDHDLGERRHDEWRHDERPPEAGRDRDHDLSERRHDETWLSYEQPDWTLEQSSQALYQIMTEICGWHGARQNRRLDGSRPGHCPGPGKSANTSLGPCTFRVHTSID